MCQAITTKGEKCKNKISKYSKDKYCLRHRNLINLSYKQKEVCSLNKTIQRRNSMIDELTFDIIEKNKTIEELENDLNSMREDFEKYQFIKKFEIIKSKVKKIVGSQVMKNPSLLEFEMGLEYNKKALQTILNCESNFYNTYNLMRLKRNAYSHKFNE